MKHILLFISIILLSNNKVNAQANSDNDSNAVFSLVDHMPSFIDGNNKIGKFMTKRFDFSKSFKSEKCFYVLVIDKTGAVSAINKLKGDAINEERLMAIFKDPDFKWVAGSHNGHKLNVKLACTFNIMQNLIEVEVFIPQAPTK